MKGSRPLTSGSSSEDIDEELGMTRDDQPTVFHNTVKSKARKSAKVVSDSEEHSQINRISAYTSRQKMLDAASGSDDEADAVAHGKHGKHYLTTRWAIDAENSFSIVFLMAARKLDFIVLLLLRMLPAGVLFLLYWWLWYNSDWKNMYPLTGLEDGRETDIKYRFYFSWMNDKVMETPWEEIKTPQQMYDYIVSIWTVELGRDFAVIFLVNVCIFLPQMVQATKALVSTGLLFTFSENADTGCKWTIRLAAFATFIFDKMMCSYAAFGLSLYTAVFFSGDSLINVVVNSFALGFINEIDDGLIKIYIFVRYSNSSLLIGISDVKFKADWEKVEKHFGKGSAKLALLKEYRSGKKKKMSDVTKQQALDLEEEAYWGTNFSTKKIIEDALSYVDAKDPDWAAFSMMEMLTGKKRGLGIQNGRPPMKNLLFPPIETMGTTCRVSIGFFNMMDVYADDKEERVDDKHKMKQWADVFRDEEWIRALTHQQRMKLIQFYPEETQRFSYVDEDFPCAKINEWVTPDHLTTLYLMLKTSSSVRKLVLGDEKLKDYYLNMIRNAVKENRHVTELVFSTAPENPEGDAENVRSDALAKILKANDAVRCVRFRNGCTTQGCQVICAALKNNLGVTELDLSTNPNFDEHAASAIAEYIDGNERLTKLAVNRNINLGEEGFRKLAPSLKTNTTLQRLRLCFNQFKSGGAEILAEVLAENRSLQYVTFHGNTVTLSGLQTLVKALQHNKTLRELTIDDFGGKAGTSSYDGQLCDEASDSGTVNEIIPKTLKAKIVFYKAAD